MQKSIILFLFSFSISAVGQKIDKLITEKDVARIIKTLSADDMMGRPSMNPLKMEKATAFIENEFKDIGLSPLTGLTGFRQEFQKEKIKLLEMDVLINGISVSNDHVILVTEKTEIATTTGFAMKIIAYDSSKASVKDQYFFAQAFAFVRDTTSELIVVDPEFESSFRELKGYFKQRFLSHQTSTKIFVLGKVDVSFYSVKAKQKIEVINKMTNVVGVLKGKSRADEIVVFSGHYDHLGIINPNQAGDSIANGADDDASGTTAVIELARYFKKLKRNNRTIIFVAFTAEEIGGFGSQYFSKQVDAEKTVAMFNIEMIGKPSKWGQNSAFITGFDKSDFGTILQKNLVGSPFQFKPDPYPEQNLFYRSDNATLARLGVPAHTISTDQIDSDPLYHTVDDEFESMDIKNITNTVKAIAISAESILEGKDTPKRIDQSSVR